MSNSQQSFYKAPNKRCLRGLQFDYTLAHPTNVDLLARNLRKRLGESTFQFEEQLGPQRVIRLVLKFVAEIRIGDRENQVTLIHRMSADTQRRLRTEELLENTLTTSPIESVEAS